MAKTKPGPKPENPKDITIRARVDKITLVELNEIVTKKSTTRSDVIREGIHKVYEDLED